VGYFSGQGEKCVVRVLTGCKRYSNIVNVRKKADQQAEVVKLVDTQRSGRCTRKGVGVRVPPSA
jgi:hypothetical protein